MISIHNLSISLGNRIILNGINLNIADNSKTVIIGKSGCGKTVLMKTIIGLFRPDMGKVIIDGEDVYHSNSHLPFPCLNKIGMLFQNAALLDSFTVFQNVALPLFENTTMNHTEIYDKVYEILSYVGLSDSAQLYPSELSGGMRKRIGLARSLVTNPRYIILDEPTTGLDPITSREVLDFLLYVIKNKKLIPITITHDPFCIKELGENIVIIEHGTVLFSGNISELKKVTNPKVSSFFNSFFV